MTFKLIENPQEGEPVQFLGVYCLRWRPEWGEPSVAFVEDDETEELVENLKKALKDTMDWIENWEADFQEDEEWLEQEKINKELIG